MKRRTLLATLGVAATAGCTGVAPPETPPSESTTATSTSTTTTSDRHECPSFASDPDRTVCWPTEDRLESRVYLNASIPVFEPDPDDSVVESLEFVLHDQHPDHPVEVTPDDWRIHRRTTAGWSPVASESSTESRETIRPGERYTWSLTFQTHPTPQPADTTYIVESLEDGTYAFQTVARLLGDEPLRVECVAIVEVRRQ